MDRRESLKMILLGALGTRGLAPSRLAADTGASGATAARSPSPALRPYRPTASAAFASRWHEWPDMRWSGPEHWGNRLQDWIVEGGRLVCRTRAPDRTLHCLTHRVEGPAFTTRVSLPVGVPGSGPDDRVGFRFGLQGRFAGVRSAAVHGTGPDAGVDGEGFLRVGEARSAEPVEGRADGSTPLILELRSTRSPGGAQLELLARHAVDGPVAARVRTELPLARVEGNVALVSHLAGGDGPGAGFTDWMLDGPDVVADPESAFGPVLFAQYTQHRGILKLTAQMAPVDAIAGLEVALELRADDDGAWHRVATAPIDPLARTARFRIGDWDGSRAAEYRVRLTVPLASGPTDFAYPGRIAAEPSPDVPLKAAVFSCNADHGFPDAEVVEHVSAHAPDLALFLGDQFYEGSGGFGIQTSPVDDAALDMLHKWSMFGWSYRDIFRGIPAAFIPDDHDVYHGNVWGEGGKVAPTDEGWGAVAQDQGGYKMPAEWVDAVQMAQTSHLPDPFDPTPVDQGIGVYYTAWTYGGVSFAVLEDRKFKSAPANVLPPEARVLNGWIQNPEFDVRQHPDPPGAQLLGERQMRFLESWIDDWSGGAYQKVVLSQTNFAAVHTIPESAASGAVLPGLPMPAPGEYVEGDKFSVDMDTNSWPQARRQEVLRLLRRGAAFHIAGDQHLATVVRYGIDDFDDAGFAFTGPALNNIWPRRWWPPREARVDPLPRGGPAYTGRFFDGFGNRVTVHAAANPRATGLEPALIRDRVTGYGLVTFDKAAGTIAMECWPRQSDPRSGGAQYEGWPVVARRAAGDGRTPTGRLPRLDVVGLADPVVEVRRDDGTAVYSLRMVGGDRDRLPVFAEGRYTVRVGDPDRGLWQERTGVEPGGDPDPLVFRFGDPS